MEKKQIQTKFGINGETKIHNSVGAIFGSRVCTHTVDVNAYFEPRRTNRPLSTFNNLKFNTKYNMDYCRQSYFCPEKASIIITNIEFSGLEAISATI